MAQYHFWALHEKVEQGEEQQELLQWGLILVEE